MIAAVLLVGAAAAATGGAPQQIAPPVTPAAAARTDQVATAADDTGMEQLPPDARAVRQPVAGRPVAGKQTRASPPDDLARTYAAVVAQDRTLDTERLVRAVGPETLAQLVTEIGRPDDLGPGELKPGDLNSGDLKGAIPKGVVVIGPTRP